MQLMWQGLTTPTTNAQKMVSASESYDFSVDFCLLLCIVSTFSSEFLLISLRKKRERHHSQSFKRNFGQVLHVRLSLSLECFCNPLPCRSWYFLLWCISAILFQQQMIWTCLNTRVHRKCLKSISSDKFGIVSSILKATENLLFKCGMYDRAVLPHTLPH